VRLAQGAEIVLLAFLAFLVVLDIGLATTAGSDLDGLVPLSGAVTVAAVALRRRGVEQATAVAVSCSLVVSLLTFDRGVHPSAADAAGLLVLTVLVARLVARPEVVLYLLGILLALEGNALRPDAYRVSPVFLLTVLFVLALSFGGYLRWLDLQRAQAAVTARRDERLDLARELHDLVAHYVTGIVVQAQAGQLVAEQRPEAARDALVRIERAGTDALTAMRRMVGSLRSDTTRGDTEPPAGSAGLEDLVDEHNAAGIPTRLRLVGIDADALPPEVGAAVHRIVLESLTNVRRHSVDVTQVDVELARRGDTVEVVVRDDGREAHLRSFRSPGYGLVGMSERAAALGGTLTAGPAPDGRGGGWQVVASLPLDPQD
jgi:signal transduction histidine kinase